jgi:hypothetical protein
MSLDDDVNANRRNIRSDGYTMSLGEVVNMYRDREIIIRPEYQRLFRWTIIQQSRLIESILLDIPLPPIFVAQEDDGTWEVVDGLQRLSTILQFMNELRVEPSDTKVPPVPLVATRYLPSLEGATWDKEPNCFSNALRINFKRARLDMRILLRESDKQIRYELFDRLNSGGAPTSPQEVRTAILLMEQPDFYRWLDTMRDFSEFQACVPLTERQVDEQYDLELVLRFIALQYSDGSSLRLYPDMETILTERALELARDAAFDRDAVLTNFREMFAVLWSVGPDVFRRYDERRGRSVGAFSVSAYEAVTQGVSTNLQAWMEVPPSEREDLLRLRIAELWSDAMFRANSGGGLRPTQRIPFMSIVGSRIFVP